MALPTSGPLSLQEIAGAFGGAIPVSLSQYYAGGGLVPAGTTGTNGPVPSSGPISISNFYGTSNSVNLEILVVAGGGGGSNNGGGGGGGGGIEHVSVAVVNPATTFYSIVGVGGGTDASGGGSSFSGGILNIAAIGGGGGGDPGQNGGSGGGGPSGRFTSHAPGSAIPGGGGVAYGHNGGPGYFSNPDGGANYQLGGGGGGAGAAGTAGVSGGTGGAGAYFASFAAYGQSGYFGGGGGAGGYRSLSGTQIGYGTAGGIGGGGTTGSSPTGIGGMGGGGAGRCSGEFAGYTGAGPGGSGVVLVQYTATRQLWYGGTVSHSGSTYTHAFYSNGTLIPIPATVTITYYGIGGGGSSGNDTAGGASAAGAVVGQLTMSSNTSATVVIGNPGAKGYYVQGGTSSISYLTGVVAQATGGFGNTGPPCGFCAGPVQYTVGTGIGGSLQLSGGYGGGWNQSARVGGNGASGTFNGVTYWAPGGGGSGCDFGNSNNPGGAGGGDWAGSGGTGVHSGHGTNGGYYGGGGGGSGNYNGGSGTGGPGVFVITYVSPIQRATGGTITSSGDGDNTVWQHVFTSSGILSVN